jgi:enterochelin esterase-like enzyme
MLGPIRRSILAQGSAFSVLILSVACSVPSAAPEAGGGAGAAQGGMSGAGAGGAGATGLGGSAGAGSGGLGGGGGSSGTAGGGTGGSGGSGGGTLPPGCESLGTPGNTGIQCDPTAEGNGTHDQVEPDGEVPPEAEGEREGQLTETQTYQSSSYGYGFDYRVYVPGAYQAGKPAALMVFQDGANYSGDANKIRVPQIMDTLIAAGEMPVAIAVFIEPGSDRSAEYDTRSEKYGAFLLGEFLPDVILASYDIVDDPNGWLIGGHSSGGACAFNAAWFNVDKFRKVMTNNGTFVGLQDPGNDDYIEMLVAEASRPLRITMLSGTQDLGDGTWFNANNDMAASLQQAQYAYRYMKSSTSHDLAPWSTSDAPDALRWLWRGYSLPHYEALP